MENLKSKKNIDSRTESDKLKKDTGTEKASAEVDDKITVEKTDKATKDAGTEEGGRELNKAFKGSMDSIDEEHEKQDAEMEMLFNEIEKIEKELDYRKEQTNSDAKTIAIGTGKMVSRESIEAQRKMRDAENIAKEDAKYLGKSAEKERTTRTEGKQEMASQKSKIKSIRPKVR